MIEITSYRQVAILNHHHGTETAQCLRITVRGIPGSDLPVKVNGIPARMDGIFRRKSSIHRKSIGSRQRS